MFRRARRLSYGLISLGFVPWAWRAPCFAMLGVLAGLALALGHVSRAPSYLSDRPEACVNCHVMRPQYASWRHSSHARVTTCNDCHVPHDNVAATYAFKARDGLYHSTIFTLRLEPQVIRISSGAVPVVEANCRRCHEPVLAAVAEHAPEAASRLCWDCHREVPHGSARSLSASPAAMNPELAPVTSPPQSPRIGGRLP
ncbi:MAG: cytochrome c nitrite reductase small subunit [Pirellulales bacterium]|nr:cytochrome c nitrite reductase small subunit [Pirellulales bacterium]